MITFLNNRLSLTKMRRQSKLPEKLTGGDFHILFGSPSPNKREEHGYEGALSLDEQIELCWEEKQKRMESILSAEELWSSYDVGLGRDESEVSRMEHEEFHSTPYFGSECFYEDDIFDTTTKPIGKRQFQFRKRNGKLVRREHKHRKGRGYTGKHRRNMKSSDKDQSSGKTRIKPMGCYDDEHPFVERITHQYFIGGGGIQHCPGRKVRRYYPRKRIGGGGPANNSGKPVKGYTTPPHFSKSKQTLVQDAIPSGTDLSLRLSYVAGNPRQIIPRSSPIQGYGGNF